MKGISLSVPSEEEMREVSSYIHEYELDDRSLKKEEFVIAKREGKLVGFGRLRQHADCEELCSLGVVTPFRRKGIGKAIVKEIMNRSKRPLYLVCIIPEYFEPMDFRTTANYPAAISNKLSFCTIQLVVPESYCVMRFR